MENHESIDWLTLERDEDGEEQIRFDVEGFLDSMGLAGLLPMQFQMEFSPPERPGETSRTAWEMEQDPDEGVVRLAMAEMVNQGEGWTLYGAQELIFDLEGLYLEGSRLRVAEGRVVDIWEEGDVVEAFDLWVHRGGFDGPTALEANSLHGIEASGEA